MTTDPIDLLFGGMAKLGPGDDAHTLQVLRSLPRRPAGTVVDAGCGTGRQTLVLARELGVPIDAVDLHAPFLATLGERARAQGLGHLVRTHCRDIRDVAAAFPAVDLLWSEGAAYAIGFANALATWAAALRPGAHAVVSELAWLRADPPAEARAFFDAAYPAMQTVAGNVALARAAGYRLLHTHTLPAHAWVEGYYDVLAERARVLLTHPDAPVRGLAAETLREIEVFTRAQDSYGYVFLVLQRA